MIDWLKKVYATVYQKDGLRGAVVVTLLILLVVFTFWFLQIDLTKAVSF